MSHLQCRLMHLAKSQRSRSFYTVMCFPSFSCSTNRSTLDVVVHTSRSQSCTRSKVNPDISVSFQGALELPMLGQFPWKWPALTQRFYPKCFTFSSIHLFTLEHRWQRAPVKGTGQVFRSSLWFGVLPRGALTCRQDESGAEPSTLNYTITSSQCAAPTGTHHTNTENECYFQKSQFKIQLIFVG